MFGLQRTSGIFLLSTIRRAYSSANVPKLAASPQKESVTKTNEVSSNKSVQNETSEKKAKSQLVEAAFESLKEDKINNSNSSAAKASNSVNIDERIINAKTVNGLLSISELNVPLSRKHALKIVSILSDWSTIDRVKLSEFENDSRFLRICRMLGRLTPKNGPNSGSSNANNPNSNNNNGKNQKSISGFRTDDLNTVLGVAGDDEAAKLIASISLPQMVKVMSTLAQRKRRSTPLLRSLAFNISSATEPLDLKQCADVLFAMASLNFPDSVLAAKMCSDIQVQLPKNKEKSAVVGSILTSLGILKYRDLDILECLTQWILQNTEICRPQDLSAFFLTSAILNFKSTNIEEVKKKLGNIIVKEDFPKPVDWLNHVWALALLGIVEQNQLSSVLSPEFIKRLGSTKQHEMSQTTKMKLLNLNSHAKLIYKDYKGPLLAPNSSPFDVLLVHAKSKQILLNSMLDALKSLLPSTNHVKSLVDSKMGFLIDAFCLFDKNRNPLPLDKESDPNAIKVALMVVDFHDVCHGTHRCASGITTLSFDLLEKSGYRVIPVPYSEFSTSDKLLKRVQYLEGKFKTTIDIKK